MAKMVTAVISMIADAGSHDHSARDWISVSGNAAYCTEAGTAARFQSKLAATKVMKTITIQ
jgi:hypothetical protein